MSYRLIIAGTRPPEPPSDMPIHNLITYRQAWFDQWHRERIPLVAKHVKAFDLPFAVTHVVCGKARGWDTVGELWAKSIGMDVDEFPAQWKRGCVVDKAAGMKRNAEMAAHGNALLAFWDGKSSGTRNMIENAAKHKLPTRIVSTTGDLSWMSRWRGELRAEVVSL